MILVYPVFFYFLFILNFVLERLGYLFLYFFGGSQFFFFFFSFRATEIWGGRSQDKRNGITTNKKIDFYFSGKHFTKEN